MRARNEAWRKHYGTKAYRENRVRALRRDGNRCILCGDDRNIEVHHITRLADGGSDLLGNLATMCATCNRLADAQIRR